MSKPIIDSKTIIVNAVVLLFSALEYNLHMIQPYLPVNYFVAVSIGLPVINGLLRLVTSQPVTLSLRRGEYVE